ncbi:uracil phosphoribosyltransferase [Cupriavidus sp. USMAHM13]|uniref:URC4/urg3 family protein n=1 Tax=Cupriavidus sp. USMAHM13 TaxID=1389192 RepID=UPI0008A6B973|nr:URC4/urg3 family protein [Cupriavidus sp. USMAHM13]AOZ03339.1 uracil phosphoribosyltransferase [Cupriavidus sp. USMAHM13]
MNAFPEGDLAGAGGADAGSGWLCPLPEGHLAAALLSARAVRKHCAEVTRFVASGESALFSWHPERVPEIADYVSATIRRRYPDLVVPYHSRWRHFEAGGPGETVDRWRMLCERAGLNGPEQREERARIGIDLVIPSVLLDAGAGPDWRYRDSASDQMLSRSEGLGVASFDLFARGGFSAALGDPLRADAERLMRIDVSSIASAFQVAQHNPLVGLDGRAGLLRRLGEVAQATPAVFGAPARLGNLFDYLRAHASDGRIEAGFVLRTLLVALGPVWPGRMVLDGVPLGDCWRHAAAAGGLVPLHKLTQWLTYSMLEPLEDGGLTVTGLDALTGLPEYRNGGLLYDFALMVPRDPGFAGHAHTVGEPAIVEWRALTVSGLDLVAQSVRDALGLSAEAFPLARVLEGGTWAAGRRIAAQRRPGGPPPFSMISDGTVF